MAEIATLITAPAAGSMVQAIAASPGIAIGPAHIQVLQTFDYPLRGESSVVERERLQKALNEVRQDIEGLISRSQSKAIR
ncbi:phosphoenolpyruvate-utilizing N-terminal domain-containing protein, partial [Acinetobacter baumannii]|uniref:phosphoenolpyruvate-utilizing N-terminal domain-containing protein n=1 Tax=Acinetobacter baumannii TaxID=470 RepID=UPI003332ADEB